MDVVCDAAGTGVRERDPEVADKYLGGHHGLLRTDAVEPLKAPHDLRQRRSAGPYRSRRATMLLQKALRCRADPTRQRLDEPVQRRWLCHCGEDRVRLDSQTTEVEVAEPLPQEIWSGPCALRRHPLREEDAEQERLGRALDQLVCGRGPGERTAHLGGAARSEFFAVGPQHSGYRIVSTCRIPLWLCRRSER